MKGDIDTLCILLNKSPENPIKSSIGNKDSLKILQVIEEEYWREFRRKMEYSESPTIAVKHIGTFRPQFSHLKGYIRSIIRMIRRVRLRIEKVKHLPNFDPVNGQLADGERELIKKLRAALKQLDEMRKIMIVKQIKWNRVYIEKGKPEKVIKHYERIPFSFIDKSLIIEDV